MKNLFKKTIIVSLIVVGLLGGVGFPRAEAKTTSELRAEINDLRQRISQLLEQLEKKQEETFYFENRLEMEDRGKQVKKIQQLLNENPETRLRSSGPGSPGRETEFFGPLTRRAVIKFQEKYAKEVLAPWGFNSGTGIVGATTLKKLNQLLDLKEINREAVTFSSLALRQGDTLKVTVESDKRATVSWEEKEIDLHPLSGKKTAFLPIKTKLSPGFHQIVIENSEEEFLFETINVKERDFPVTELKTTPELERRGYTPEGIRDRLAQDNQQLFEKVFSREVGKFHFEEKFTEPLEEMVNVGAYGNIRKNGGVALQHLGVDLQAATETPVYAVNEGKVVFARNMADYGKTMVVEHGGGVNSLYLHLSEYLTQEGDPVEKGEKIALSGNTGYSLAPHLHFSLNVHGESIDPLRFLEQ